MNQGGQPNNEIWYTTTDGAALTLGSTDFGASILTHTYEAGNSRIIFDSAVTHIGHSAFRACTSLASIILPKCVTEIYYDAFMDCTSLTSITIPESITTIRSDAFSGCTSLSSVYINDLASWCNIQFENNTANPLHNGAKLYISGVVNNQKFSVPEGVVHIKDYAFCGLLGLVEVNIPSTVASVGVGAFNNAGFSYLSIDSIAIESIGDYAFAGANISNVSFVGAPPRDVGTDIFGLNYSEVSIYVPSEHLEAYQALLPQYNITGE